MRWIIIKIQEFFVSEKKPELATVPVDKLQHWSDLQYKPLLKNTYEQMRKQLIVCNDSTKSLDLLITDITDFQPINQRVDVHTKILNKKHILLKSLKLLQKELLTIEGLNDLFEMHAFYKRLNKEILDIVNIRQEVGEILREHMGKLYSQVIQVTHDLDKNVKQVRELFSDSINASYLETQKLAQDIVDKREKSTYYTDKMAITKSNVLERRKLVDELRAKISRIKNDPKYILEKQSIHNGVGKFGLSFYDLEIDKFEKQVSELAQTIVSLKDHYHKLSDAKNELNIEGSTRTFRERMLRDFNIEVDLVNSENK